MDDDKLYLNDSELRDLDKAHYEERIDSLELKNLELLSDKLKKELTLLSANYTLKNKEIEEINVKILDAKNKLEKKKEEHGEFINKIRDKYCLNEKWGFDPITGEVINE